MSFDPDKWLEEKDKNEVTAFDPDKWLEEKDKKEIQKDVSILDVPSVMDPTFGLAPRIGSALGAGIEMGAEALGFEGAYPGEQTFGQAYEKFEEARKKKEEAVEKQYPVLSTASSIASDVVMPLDIITAAGPVARLIGRVSEKVGPKAARAIKAIHDKAIKRGQFTTEEMVKIEKIADKFDVPIDVVGSRAGGKGRKIFSDYPMGKGPKTKSDIDIAPSSKIADIDIETGGKLSDALKEVGADILRTPATTGMPKTTFAPKIAKEAVKKSKEAKSGILSIYSKLKGKVPGTDKVPGIDKDILKAASNINKKMKANIDGPLKDLIEKEGVENLTSENITDLVKKGVDASLRKLPEELQTLKKSGAYNEFLDIGVDMTIDFIVDNITDDKGGALAVGLHNWLKLKNKNATTKEKITAIVKTLTALKL